MIQHDVIIVGDGVIGLTLALLLAQHDFNVGLLTRKTDITLPTDKQKYDNRVSAITPASEQLFKKVGAWDAMVARRVGAFRDMHVWDATGTGTIHFDSAWLGQTHLGHIIENKVMLNALHEQLPHYPNLQIYEEFDATALLPGEYDIVLRGKQNLQAKLVVGAEGANSWVRQQAGIQCPQRSYGQTAIVCTVQTAKPHQETAWQRFLPTGPLAFLPLNSEDFSSIVWSCTSDYADTLLKMSDEQFKQTLATQFEHRLGDIISCSPRMSFPLIMQHAEHYVQPQIALVGDAAHTIHPLAGQGMNMGLADVAELTKTLLYARDIKRPLGYLPILKRYERERRTATIMMQTTVAGFKQLFSNENPWLTTLRNNGLNIADKLPWLKNFFMHQAMGQ
jgi:2-octaprenylphenol hydroxylase